MKIRERIAKLIDVKSLVTLAITVVFCVLSVRRDLSADQFLTVFTIIISFYFGTQYQKNAKKKEDDSSDI